MVELITVLRDYLDPGRYVFRADQPYAVAAVDADGLAALNVLATGYEMYYFENRAYPQWGPGEKFGSPKGDIGTI